MTREELQQKGNAYVERYLEMVCEMTTAEYAFSPFPSAETAFQYVKIEQISKRWETEEKAVWEIMTDLFVGLFTLFFEVSVIFASDGKELGVYLGCEKRNLPRAKQMLRSAFPQIDLAEKDYAYPEIVDHSANVGGLVSGGVLKGNPVGSENFLNPYQIDAVIKGMAKKPWAFVIFAAPEDKASTTDRQLRWLSEASACSELTDVTYSSGDGNYATTTKKNYAHAAYYGEKVQAFCEKTAEGLAIGEWCVTANFFASGTEELRPLGGLLSSAFYAKDSAPEPLHAMINRNVVQAPMTPEPATARNICYGGMRYPRYSTLLTSRELAVLAAFPTLDTAGFSTVDHVNFDVNRETCGDLTIGHILDSGEVTENSYSIDANEFNRHCLVVGLTGSGKTNTVKSLLHNLSRGTKKRPFMVIEPAKKEYWELYKLNYTDLQVYSVGANEPNAHPFCLNPFERAVFTDESGRERAVPIQTHIDFVYAAFKASFILYSPMPYVLERCIYEIYEDCGWDIHNNVNRFGKDIYPTIEDLYYKIPAVVTDMGYDSKMRHDLIGSLQARINSMRLGSKGDTLNVRRSFPIGQLLNGNVVIELEDIGDDDVKAFIISLILVNLLEYRRQQEDAQLKVRHLMLIEEAHRLLKNVQSGTGENADPRGAAVEFFCNLLAELRSKGQGFIVADQIPSKLAPDLIKNTNLKIVHRTVAAEERELVGGAMHMTPEQIESLSVLKQGNAAIYSEGDNRPKLVRPLFAGDYANPALANITRNDVLAKVGVNCIRKAGDPKYASQTNARPPFCRACKGYCTKRAEEIFQRFPDPAYAERRLNMIVQSVNPDKTVRYSILKDSVNELIEDCKLPATDDRDEARRCLLCLLIARREMPKDTVEKLTLLATKKTKEKTT